MDSAYVDDQGLMESKRAYKRRLYNTLYHISRGETDIQDMRITKIWPNTDWSTVWKNIYCTAVPGETNVTWYNVTHDILPTNVRLYRIRMSPTDKCSNYGMHDTLQHRLIECGEGPQIWQWTQQKLALILRTISTRIPSDWLLRPQCALWPPTRRRAVMRILANVVLFRTRPNQELTLRDFIEFMQANTSCIKQWNGDFLWQTTSVSRTCHRAMNGRFCFFHIIFRNVIRHHALGVLPQLDIKYIITHQCIDPLEVAYGV